MTRRQPAAAGGRPGQAAVVTVAGISRGGAARVMAALSRLSHENGTEQTEFNGGSGGLRAAAGATICRTRIWASSHWGNFFWCEKESQDIKRLNSFPKKISHRLCCIRS